MNKPQATIVVSRPGECLLNAWPFFCRFKQKFTWKIVYVTQDHTRAEPLEVEKTWQHLPVTLQFLKQKYVAEDFDNFEISFDQDEATDLIKQSCEESDIVISHNHLGELGNVHNVFVNSVISELGKPTVYFGYANDNDNNLLIPIKTYGNALIPTQHLQWVKDYVLSKGENYPGQYFCDKEAMALIRQHDSITFFDQTYTR